jgi:hypothetical protein
MPFWALTHKAAKRFIPLRDELEKNRELRAAKIAPKVN